MLWASLTIHQTKACLLRRDAESKHMKWPFVTRARFEDAQKHIAKLETERDALRENYERVTDEINFRATGFHLYPRFEKKADAEIAAKKPQTR
jgi:hypothetical protein